MNEDEAKLVVAKIAVRLGVGLQVAEVEWAGARSFGMRLAGLENSQSFSIGLELLPRRAEAILVMDGFAGEVIRSMQANLIANQGLWPDMIVDAEENGVRTLVSVNGVHVSGGVDDPDNIWHSLDIECSKRVSKFEKAPLDSLVEVGAACLGLVLAVLEIDWADEDVEEGATEGGVTHVVSTRYERSPINRLRCIQYYGVTCWVCDSDFGRTYGHLGDGFIEVHHRTPVSQLGPGYVIDPKRDLVPLCSNCHSMIHRQNPPFAPDELRAMLGLPEKPILSRN